VLAGTMSCFIMITGYKEGPASYAGYDCTGAETGLGNPSGCTCHSSSATTGIGVTIELDSAGVPTTHYTGGKSYTVKITGTNNTSNNLPLFGFQLGCIKGSAAQTTPTNAGTWKTPYPTNVHYAAPVASYYVVGIVEHGTQLAPISGSGGNGTVYSETINWTAPAAGTGTISFWGTLNAVNGDASTGGDNWNVKHIAISEWTLNAGIVSVEENLIHLNIFPNPAKQNITVSCNLNETSEVEINMYGIDGRMVSNLMNSTLTQGEHNQQFEIPTNTKPGIYLIELIANGKSTVQRIIVE